MVKRNILIIIFFSLVAFTFFYINSTVTAQSFICHHCQRKVHDKGCNTSGYTMQPGMDSNCDTYDEKGYTTANCDPNRCTPDDTAGQVMTCLQYNVSMDNCQKGGLEFGNCQAFRGWACDSDKYTQSIHVDFWDGGAVVGGRYISDVSPSGYIVADQAGTRSECNNEGSHNFSFVTPPSLKDGATHNVYAYGKGVNIYGAEDGNNPQLNSGSPVSINCPPPPPDIQGMTVKNSSGGQTTFSGSYQISGNQSSQQGRNWLNPITITLNATPGNTATSTEYYVSFYDKSMGAVSNSSNFVTEVTNKLKPGSDNGFKGFLLHYHENTNGTGKTWRVYDPYANAWRDLKDFSSGYEVCDPTDCRNKLYYTVVPTTVARSWQIYFDKNFKGSNMYTSGYVKDNTNLDKFIQDITPPQLHN